MLILRLRSIPTQLGHLLDLNLLHLQSNRLTGPIPKALLRTNVNVLYLQKNALTGTIPREICNIDMWSCHLEANEFDASDECVEDKCKVQNGFAIANTSEPESSERRLPRSRY